MAVNPAQRGALLVAAAAVCWSTGGLIVRLATTDGWTIIFWRSLFCALFLLVVIAGQERGRPGRAFARMGAPGVAIGLCFAASSVCFITALGRTSVANALVIQSTFPFLAGLMGWLWMSERVALRTWVAMAAALTGVVLMVSSARGQRSLDGDLLSLGTAVFFAGAVVIVRRHRQAPMLPAACLAGAFAATFAFLPAAPARTEWRDLLLLVLFGVGQLGLGLILFTAGARLIPVARASLIAMLETILGPIWVWLAVGEALSQAALVGGALVLGALAVHTALDMTAPLPDAAWPARARDERS